MKAEVLLPVLLFAVATNAAQTRLEAPDFPPKEWRARITISVSDDLAKKFLERAPRNDEFFHIGHIFLHLEKDGGLSGPLKHPLLTGKVPKLFAEEEPFGRGPIAYLPIADQKTVYEEFLKALEAFKFTKTFEDKPWDASGVDIGVLLTTNGREISIEYQKLQPDAGLPEPISEAFAVLRRNLAAEYGKVFDLLKVPKLAELPKDEASKFAKCEMHDEWMRVAEVRIAYGFPSSPRQDYLKARRSLFPNATDAIPGGCVVTPLSPKTGKVLYCATCRTAEKRWLEDNPGPP